ncbi:MAG: tRNA (adenosine(37)-N6)-threonylcarbamoyltransferase complex transferase subunit TsaD, partial [Eggerthellaceae bacterium]|nr:tRNA (adenosine(37)-N6)-threonylcarbamoyltransferase complex transferase subunit TsaD [Eggerthellaceae bacterium]
MPRRGYEDGESRRFVLAFDTANEVVALGLGNLDVDTRRVEVVATREISARRASNTTLVPADDELLSELGIARSQIACVCVGRGPGSFTGVRIAMATAKGIASALGVGLVGISTLDAIAWNAQAAGVRGNLLVVADAMRKEVYPVRFSLFDDDVRRLAADRVVKADVFANELQIDGLRTGECDAGSSFDLLAVGDGLVKYRDLYEPYCNVLDESLWDVSGRGLLLALEQAWRAGDADPLDAARHDPALALPVYTRLSDAEENERIRLAANDPKNLATGVQDVAPDGGKGRATMHAKARLTAKADAHGIAYRPLDAAHAAAVAALEREAWGTAAWNESLIADELGQRNRMWWVAEVDGGLVGYAGGLVVDGDLQVLKIAVSPVWRRQGIARELLTRIAEDARTLGAQPCSLVVRAANAGAQAFYEQAGLVNVGVRPRYYSDREDAVIMQGPVPVAQHDVAGMELQHHETAHEDAAPAGKHPLILAIESSCDETAASVVDAGGNLLSDVVASQIDFHARFGGVVPEIASRKHIEAICGVCAEALDVAGFVRWRDLDAIAVTYAPGLLGALVVGVAFAKGAAWALDVPFIGVNHLEGHLYANKIGDSSFAPPAVVSLVSGGNTMLVHMRDWGDYVTLGATIDDAVGEAFDKVSKALGLGYPGGPVISREAAKGDPAAIDFPRAMLHSHDLRFSLSGLKTAVVNYINKER